MASAKPIVLITGANNGIGFGLASLLVGRGSYHVLVVEMLQIDVTDDDSIENAARTVERKHGRVDIVVNNAAVVPTESSFRQQMRESFDTNATGPAAVVRAFGPLLKKSTMKTPPPRIVNVSSGAGSIGRCLDPTSPLYGMLGYTYRASKAALNMVTACNWVEYGPDIKVFAYDPGFTISNLSSHNTAESGARPAEDSALSLVDVLEGKRDHEAGQFLHNTGTYPW